MPKEPRRRSKSPTETGVVQPKRAASPEDIRASKEDEAPKAKRRRHGGVEETSAPLEDRGGTRRQQSRASRPARHSKDRPVEPAGPLLLPSHSRTLEVPFTIATRSKRRHDIDDDPVGLDPTRIATTARPRPTRTKKPVMTHATSKKQRTSLPKRQASSEERQDAPKKRKTDENTSPMPPPTPPFGGVEM